MDSNHAALFLISGSARLAMYAFIVLCLATSFAADMHSIAVDVTDMIPQSDWQDTSESEVLIMLNACDWVFRCLEPASC